MKRIFRISLCLFLAVIALLIFETVAFADTAESAVYTVCATEEGYALVSGGVSIYEADELSRLLEYIPTSGEYELYFDTVSTDGDLAIYGGNVRLTGVLTFLGDASLTLDGARLEISGAAVAFESGHLRVKRGQLTISAGSITSGGIAVISDFSASATVNVKGGSISSDTSSAIFTERGSVNISGGSVRGAETAILAYTNVTLSGTPILSGGEYDLITDTEPTLFWESEIYRGAARIKLLSDFPEGRATVIAYARARESLIGITLFDINGICHPIRFLESEESGVGESVGAVLRPYEITFYHGDDILIRSDYIKGREIEAPEPPNVIGYSFSGWRTADGELYDCYAEEVATRSIMLANSKRRILLCDSSKLGHTSTFYQANLSDVDLVVSDRDLNGFFKDPTPEKYILAE